MKSTNLHWIEAAWVGLILLLPLCILFPSLNAIPFPSNSIYSDLVISHLPNIIEVRSVLSQSHKIPLWSETILGGYPFISDPLSGIWYPPIWLAWFMPIPFSINLLIILHLYFVEIGMFLFLRKYGYGSIPAVCGALIAGLAPKIWGHYAYGHITLVFAYAWTPWLLFFTLSNADEKKENWLAPGMILAFIILADLRWFVYAYAIYLTFKIYLSVFNADKRLIPNVKRLAKEVFFNTLTAFVLCLPFLLLVFQYSQWSTRSTMTITDQLNLSLPLEGLFGFLFPDMAGNAEWITYAGALTLLVIVNLFFSKLDKDTFFWSIILAGAVFFAMGVRPLSDIILKIPGLNLLRVPSRAILISIFAIGVLTTKSVELIIQHPKVLRIPKPFWFNLLSFGMGVFSALIVVGMSFFMKGILIKFIWGAGFYLLFFVLLLIRDREIISGKVFGIIVLPLIVLDLLTVGFSQVRFANYETVLNEKAGVVQKIKDMNEAGRIYSPSNSVPQQIAALNRLEMVNGIDPMQLKNYFDYMSSATGVPSTAYSVTIPPFDNGNPDTDNQNRHPDLQLMGNLNVRYLISEFAMPWLDQFLIDHTSGSYIYENPDYLSRARLMGASGQISLKISQTNPGKYELDATGPGTLVLSENQYPGWNVSVDGIPQQDLVYDKIFQSVVLSSGYHHIVFLFVPQFLVPSLGLVCVIMIVFWGRKIVHT